MPESYIFQALRTARGKGKKTGALHQVTPLHLLKACLKKIADISRFELRKIDDVIIGCVTPIADQGGCIARAAVLASNYPVSVPAQQINRFCASGLEAVGLAALKVKIGMADFAIGGGVESMSRVPMLSDGGSLLYDSHVTFKYGIIPQGVAADLIATKYGFLRHDLDLFAYESHQKALAFKSHPDYFLVIQDAVNHTLLDHDENIRETSMNDLEKLSPAFAEIAEKVGFAKLALHYYPDLEKINHVHTAGNSSALADGASAVLVGSLKAGKSAGLAPKAKIISCMSLGSDPTMMLDGPIALVKKMLKAHKMTIHDIDLWEINEAFAAIPLMLQQELNLESDKINKVGGAIALGHPLGATGSILVSQMVENLHYFNKQLGMIVLCVAGGMATAMLIERV